MPLIVSESKSNQDPNQTYLTQALLSSSPGEDVQEENLQELSRRFDQVDHLLSSKAQQDDSISRHSTEMTSIRFSQAEFTMKTLGWLTCPVTTCAEDTELPAISVYSDPEICEELEMIVHSNGEGTAQTTGQRRVNLRSQGSNKPSVATFEGIHIKRAGLYVVEVHSVRQPELSLVADHPITIVPKFDSHGSFGDGGLPEELGMAKAQMWGA